MNKFIILFLFVLPIAANAQSYAQDTVWTKKTDQSSGFYQVKFSNNDSIIVGHGYEKAIFYNALNGEEIARLPFNAEVHFFDNDEKFLQLAQDEKNIIIYDAKTLFPLDTIENDGVTIGRYDITDNGKYIIGVINNGLRIWDLETKAIIKTRLFNEEIGLINWSARQIKVLCNDIEFLLLEAKTYYNPDDPDNPLIKGYQKKYSIMSLDSFDILNNSRSFRISNTCQYLAFKTGDPTYGVEIYDFNTKQLIHRLPINGPSLTGIEFSPDDKFIVTSGHGIIVWDVITGQNTYFYPGDWECMDVSNDGKTIISNGSRDFWAWHSRFGGTPIQEIPIFNELLYPNPTTGLVNIDNIVTESIKIYNTNGLLQKTIKPINSDRGIEFNVSNLPNGEYLISLEGKDIITYKLIINK